jgi:hypothetical protein
VNGRPRFFCLTAIDFDFMPWFNTIVKQTQEGTVIMTRAQKIEALKAKLSPQHLPVLSEGDTYRLELLAHERVERATLLRIIDDAPLGRGFSFQLKGRRIFVYERDLRPGPAGSIISMAA